MAGKYDRLIKPLSIGIRTWEAPAGGQAKPGASVVGPGNAKKEVWLNGREHLEGVGFNISWGVHNTVGRLARRRQGAYPFLSRVPVLCRPGYGQRQLSRCGSGVLPGQRKGTLHLQ